MKKKYLLLTLLCMSAVIISACGKTKVTGKLETLHESESTIIQDEDVSLKESVDEDGVSNEGINGMKLYDKSPEWENYTVDDQVVQLCDTIYQRGCTAEEFMDKIESSEIEYTNNYNGDKLLAKSDDEIITIYKDGTEIMEIECSNRSGKTSSLSNAMVCSITLTDEVLKYCRFLDGRSYDEILEMTYDDVINLSDSMFKDYNVLERQEYVEQDLILLCIRYVNGRLELKTAEWTGKDYWIGTHYLFGIDPDTSKVVRFKLIAGNPYTFS